VLAPKLQLVLDLLARHASSAEAAHALGKVVTVGGRDRRPGVEAGLEALLPSAADFNAFRTAIWGR
jgi:hypothetical protein